MKLRDVALNAATAVATLVALGAVAARLWPSHAAAAPTIPAELRSRSVPDWRTYAHSTERYGAAPETAPVTIIEFADFQCPFCRQAVGVLDTVLARHPNDVAILWRNDPLDQHHYALGAARAAVCATRQHAFLAYHHALFANADSLGHIPWTRLAKTAGVSDLAAFDACTRDTTAFPEIDADAADAARLGAIATPTFLVNDRFIAGNPGVDSLDRLIDRALPARR